MANASDCLVDEIRQELDLLGKAIMSNDVAAIELHTAAARESLRNLGPLLPKDPGSDPQIVQLRACARQTESLLARSLRTARALLEAYRTVACSSESLAGSLR
jgi:hypothetical protein